MGATFKKSMILALMGLMTFTLAIGCGDGKRRKSERFRPTFTNKNGGKTTKGGDKADKGGGDIQTDGSAGDYSAIMSYANQMMKAGDAVDVTGLPEGRYRLTGIFTNLTYVNSAKGENFAAFSATDVDANGGLTVSADPGRGVVGVMTEAQDAGREIQVPTAFGIQNRSLDFAQAKQLVLSTRVAGKNVEEKLAESASASTLKHTEGVLTMITKGTSSGVFNGQDAQVYKSEDATMILRKVSDTEVLALINLVEDASAKDLNVSRSLFLTYTVTPAEAGKDEPMELTTDDHTTGGAATE